MKITKQSDKQFIIELNLVDLKRLSYLSAGRIFSDDDDMREFQERLMYHLLTAPNEHKPNES